MKVSGHFHAPVSILKEKPPALITCRKEAGWVTEPDWRKVSAPPEVEDLYPVMA
jgi:hypothetical protein